MLFRLKFNNLLIIFNFRLIKLCFCVIPIIGGCNAKVTSKEEQALIETDPFLNSFKNKNIKMAVSFDSKSLVPYDTLLFDREGRLVSEKKLYSLKHYGYDEDGNLIRLLVFDDVPSNYLIEYESKEDTVIQNWYHINHLRWELKEPESKVIDKVIVFTIDENQRIQESFLLESDQIIKYEYENMKLSSKVILTKSTNEPSLKFIYKYTEDGFLKYIGFSDDSVLIEEHYFGNNQILDSTITKYDTIFYRYEYY